MAAVTPFPECTAEEKLARQATEIAVLQERIKGQADAIGLQAKEYERRLSELNHAHAQAVARNELYLPREVYDKAEITRELRISVLKERLDKMEGRSAGIGLSLSTAISILIGAGAIVGIVVALFMRTMN